MKSTTTGPWSAGPLDFRQTLQAELARRCRRNARYSLRAFARSLAVDHGTLGQILRGTRPLTERTIRDMGGKLGLDGTRIDALVLRQREADAGTVVSDQVRRLAGDAAVAMAQWHHQALLELVRVADFRPDVRWIARALDLGVDEVNVALQRLLRLRLLRMESKDRWVVPAEHTLASAADFSRATLQQLLRQVDALRQRSVRERSADQQLHEAATLAIDTRKIPLAAPVIRRLHHELAAVLQSEDGSDDVYRFETSLFPLTVLRADPPEEDA